jgi:hypothetical protein
MSIDPELIDAYVAELGIHDWSPAHPYACLCAEWDGFTDTYLEHVAKALLGLHPGT